MTEIHRRTFLVSAAGAGAALALGGSLGALTSPVGAHGVRPGHGGWPGPRRVGLGPLVTDPAGILDLPAGFRYTRLSTVDDRLSTGEPVPGAHDGMAAFRGRGGGSILVRNHELNPEDAEEDGLASVPHLAGHTYDPQANGGTTTLVVDRDRRLVSHGVSLAGTLDNCAGGPTPWGTWLTCEETDEVVDGVKHGYVFEVDPARGGDPRPITGMGRFEHEAVSFDGRGRAYLTEDADTPFGGFYRFTPRHPGRGRGSLHHGGTLQALQVPDLVGTDLSAVTEAGTVLRGLRWVAVPVPDPAEGETVRDQVDALRIQKAEGTWSDRGGIWFVASYGGGPGAEDEEDRSAAVHGGQIWRYRPDREQLELVVTFDPASDYQGPDNITVAPFGDAVMCTDGDDDRQFVAGITPGGATYPIARNRLSDQEFAGGCFSPDGRTLFVNVQEPGTTFAIWGPWPR